MAVTPSSPKVTEFHKKKWWWVLTAALALVVYSVYPSGAPAKAKDSRSSFQVEQSAMPPVHLLPESKEPPLHFSGSRQVILPLTLDEWTRQIVIPTHPTKYVDCRIEVDPPTGYLIRYQGGRVEWMRADQKEYPDHGARRGIFRLVGTSPGQKATVTVSFRSAGN